MGARNQRSPCCAPIRKEPPVRRRTTTTIARDQRNSLTKWRAQRERMGSRRGSCVPRSATAAPAS
eukprot:4942872-Pleurochrysis_carterae.AAC.2